MAEFVIKRDGTKEPFDAQKIRNSILAAAQRTDLSEERQQEIVEKVSAVALAMAEAKETIETSEIRERILNELDGTEPAVSASWRKYDQEKARS